MDNYISKETAVTLLRDRAKQCRGMMGDLGGAVSGAAMLIESIPNTEVKLYCSCCGQAIDWSEVSK